MSDGVKSGEGWYERVFLLGAAAILGGIAGAAGMQPFVSLYEGAQSTRTFISQFTGARPPILEPIVYDGAGLVKRDAAKSQPGLTLIEGIFADGNAIVALDAEGREVHRWVPDFFKVWPDAKDVFPENRIPKTKNNVFIQGLHPFADGSVLVSFGELGTAKLDRCSNLVWRTDIETHHAITPTENGMFWVAASIPLSQTDERLFPQGYDADDIIKAEAGGAQNYNNAVALIDANGKVVRKFSVLEAIYDAGLENAIYSSAQEDVADPTHLNDIEVVTPALAAKIDGVEAGNLLLSIREMNMMAIVDQNNGRLLWHHQGPYLRQHDPDIAEDGTIEIFNNRAKHVMRGVSGSQVLKFDPATGKSRAIFPVGKADNFYSRIMGTHQTLENGNRLIAESSAGRVFEVTPTGEVVWDYRQAYDDEAAALFANAVRVPNDYFADGALNCAAPYGKT